jgi:hypothetical protein
MPQAGVVDVVQPEPLELVARLALVAMVLPAQTPPQLVTQTLALVVAAVETFRLNKALQAALGS